MGDLGVGRAASPFFLFLAALLASAVAEADAAACTAASEATPGCEPTNGADADEAALLQRRAPGAHSEGPSRDGSSSSGDGRSRAGDDRAASIGRLPPPHFSEDPLGAVKGLRHADVVYRRFQCQRAEFVPNQSAPTAPSCDRDTGFACNLGSCSFWQGPVDCVNTGGILGRRCFCPVGYCPNSDGVCVAAYGIVKADVVPVSETKPDFPGRQANATTGMCFSGGGIRATTWALGGLRPLEEWGLMQGVDVLSSVSGGSWASAMYMFAPNKTRTIIGGPTDPTRLSMQVLNSEPAAGIKTATTNYYAVVLGAFVRGVPLDMMMEYYACEAFLKPFGLCNMWAFLAPDAETVAKIKAANPPLRNFTFQVPRTDRPRAVVLMGTLLGPEGYETAPGQEVSLQMSPGYVGSPFYPEDGYVKYFSLKENEPLLRRLLGGGLLQAFAFGGAPSKKGQSGGTPAKVGAPAWPFSLAQAMGVSSMSPGQLLGNIPFIGKLVDSRYGYWPVTDRKHRSKHGMLIQKVSDGGNLDNSGLLALLQRGVRKVVWFAASYELVNRSYDLCRAPTDDDTLIKAKVIDQVLDKFGYGPNLTSPIQALLNNQVFQRESVHDVVCQLQQHLDAGTPPVLSFTQEVLTNEWWGIAGGWKVEVVLVYLEHSAQFEALLPKDTRRQLSLGPYGAFPDYPAYPTALGGGTNAQYNLLAATSEYFVRQNEALFRKILS